MGSRRVLCCSEARQWVCLQPAAKPTASIALAEALHRDPWPAQVSQLRQSLQEAERTVDQSRAELEEVAQQKVRGRPGWGARRGVQGGSGIGGGWCEWWRGLLSPRLM